MSVAEALHADIVLPKAYYRLDNYNTSFEAVSATTVLFGSVQQSHKVRRYKRMRCTLCVQGRWGETSLRTLIDVEALQENLAKDRRHAFVEFPAGQSITHHLDAAGWTFAETVEAISIAALKAYSNLQATSVNSNRMNAGVHRHFPHINLEVSFVNIKTRGTTGEQQTEYYQTVFTRLKFAKQVSDQAQQILQKMLQSEGNTLPFNGVHLRIERDVLREDQQSDELQMYLDAMAREHFNASTLLYIASGIFEADDQAVQTEVLTKMKSFSSQAVTHNTWKTNESALDTFHPEQVALVDFLVLAESKTFLGTQSTMSMFLANYRHFHRPDSVQRFVKPLDLSTFSTNLFFHNAFGEMPA